jgi:hypothetical protein
MYTLDTHVTEALWTLMLSLYRFQLDELLNNFQLTDTQISYE